MDYVRTAMNSTGRYVPSQIPGTRIHSRETRGTGLKQSDEHTRASDSDAAIVSISQEGRLQARESTLRPPKPRDEANSGIQPDSELSPKEAAQVEELKQRDKEVRAHEQAHLSALGRFRSGGPSYQYETGPNGQRYAVSGNVPVDVSPESAPEETLEKARVIRHSAMAPVSPSLQDFRVASEAAQMEAAARQEMMKDSSLAPGASDDEAISIATLDHVASDSAAEELARIDFTA